MTTRAARSRSELSRRGHILGRRRLAAFDAWRAAFIAREGREPTIEERVAERERIREAA